MTRKAMALLIAAVCGGAMPLNAARGARGILARCGPMRTRLFMSAAAEPGSKRRVVFLGTPDVAAKSLGILLDRQEDPDAVYEVVAVVTNPPARKGRGKTIVPSPVGQLAEERGIEVLTPATAKDPEFLDCMEELDADLCITAAYGQYLPKRFLRAPRFGTLNVHPSLLPLWRGASPVQRSLEAGDATTGVSVLFTVTKMDAGPIVAQEERVLEGSETAPELLLELFDRGTNLLVDAMPAVFDGSAAPAEQDEAAATAADKISAADARCDPSAEGALQIHNRARGFAGWPGTWLMLRVGGEEAVRCKFKGTRVGSGDAGVDGREVALLQDGWMALRCGDGSVLEVEMVQPHNKKMMPAKAWWNGLRGQAVQWAPAPVEEQVRS